MGPERENGSEEISFEEEDGYDEFKNMRYVDLPTELQMKVSYWNDYLVSPENQLPFQQESYLTDQIYR